MTKRVGIFGGTFDPPHLGHLILASESRSQLELDRVLWVLTAVPPHKIGRPISQLEDRLAMLKLALENEGTFGLSTVDIERPGPHFTLDTVRILAIQNPGDKMILLLGGDSLRDLPEWHAPDKLVSACHEIGVMRRPGDLIDLTVLSSKIPGVASKIRFVESPLLEISSHEIRLRALKNQPFRYYVLPSIYKYIVDHKLYKEG